MNLTDEEIAAIEAPFLLAEDHYGYRPEVAIHRVIANAARDKAVWAVVDFYDDWQHLSMPEFLHKYGFVKVPFSREAAVQHWLHSQGIERTGD